jgi:hypothetical protein
VLGAFIACGSGSAAAQTDEIQVYTGEINAPGGLSLTWHNNFTPIGRKQPDFPGGIVPQGSLNGVPEWAYGITDWMEAGLYLPVYSVTGDGKFLLDSAKLRLQIAAPHAAERRFFYAVNLEFSYNALHWEQTHFSGEIRWIVGCRFGPVGLIVNPIIDYNSDGWSSLDFAPAVRLEFNASSVWAVALEHYMDFGELRHLAGLQGEQHSLFAVFDWNGKPVGIEAGIGHGFTAASDALVLKLMLTQVF